MILFVSIVVSSLLSTGVALLLIRHHEATAHKNVEVVTRPIENPKRLTPKNH